MKKYIHFLNSLLKITLVSVAFALLISISSCGKKHSGQHTLNELAKVNSYGITVEDFEVQQKKTSYLQPNNNVTQYRDNLLNLLIDNVLLLQEAEKMKINQNKEFLKSVEHFWRQSLIHELLNMKMNEIRRNVNIGENDVLNYYNLSKDRYLVRQVKSYYDLSESCPGVSELEAFLTKNTSVQVKDTGWVWMEFREIDIKLKKILLNGQFGLNRLINVKNGNTFSCYIISNTEKNNIEPYDDIKAEIKEQLQKDYEQEQLEGWIQDLRKQAKIEINKDLLSKIMNA